MTIQRRNSRIVHGQWLQRAWAPLFDADCIEWWDADYNVNQSAGVIVDWAGRKAATVLTTGGSGPTYSASNPNFRGHASVLCATGTTQRFMHATLALSEPSYVFAVTQIPANQAYNAQLFGNYSGYHRLVGLSTGGQLFEYASAFLNSSTTSLIDSVTGILAVFSGGAGSAIYDKSGLIVSGSCGAGASAGVIIGNDETGAKPWGAPIQSIGVFKGIPSARKIEQFMRYAARIRTPPKNYLVYSQTLGNSNWVKNKCTIGAKVLAPDGTLTADSVTASDATAIIRQTGLSAYFTEGTPFVFSAWYRVPTTPVSILVEVVDIQDGAPVYSGTAEVTTTWKRFSISGTLSGTVTNLGVLLGCRFGHMPLDQTVEMWGAQLVFGTTALGEYVATTGTPVT